MVAQVATDEEGLEKLGERSCDLKHCADVGTYPEKKKPTIERVHFFAFDQFLGFSGSSGPSQLTHNLSPFGVRTFRIVDPAGISLISAWVRGSSCGGAVGCSRFRSTVMDLTRSLGSLGMYGDCSWVVRVRVGCVISPWFTGFSADEDFAAAEEAPGSRKSGGWWGSVALLWRVIELRLEEPVEDDMSRRRDLVNAGEKGVWVARRRGMQ